MEEDEGGGDWSPRKINGWAGVAFGAALIVFGAAGAFSSPLGVLSRLLSSIVFYRFAGREGCLLMMVLGVICAAYGGRNFLLDDREYEEEEKRALRDLRPGETPEAREARRRRERFGGGWF